MLDIPYEEVVLKAMDYVLIGDVIMVRDVQHFV